MKRKHLARGVALAGLCLAGPVLGQEHTDASLIKVVHSGGMTGLLTWLGLLFWGVLLLPLGILSVVHSATCRTRQWPLAAKGLGLGAAWVFVVGWAGFAQGAITTFFSIAMTSSAAAPHVLADGTSQALFSLAAGLFLCQLYLLFLSVSIILVHFRHRTQVRAMEA